MPRPKSILQRVTVDIASRAHNCQHISSHRVDKGDKRLKVAVGRSYEHFCIACALQIIESDITKLLQLKKELTQDK
jgi:hypothetical protein